MDSIHWISASYHHHNAPGASLDAIYTLPMSFIDPLVPNNVSNPAA